MAASCSVLCVHGVGHGDVDADLPSAWRDAIVRGIRQWNGDAVVSVDFLAYDDLFDHSPLNPLTYATAFAEVLASSVEHSVGDLFTRSRALTTFPEAIRWTAGMVAQWVAEDDLRARARQRVLAQLRVKPYQAVCAHSLGSLICYDTFVREPKMAEPPRLITLGSQIGNTALRNVFAGRIRLPDSVRSWYHLFNPHDHVFTADLRIQSANFTDVSTPFDLPGDPLNHDASAYLAHPNTVATVWHDLSGRAPRSFMAAATRQFARVARTKPTRRALLVGINDYPDPANRLDGCVNDAFLMSAVLQECGFDPKDIRLLLNERATATGIRQRLHWLLDDVAAGDERVLFYSGHGAQMPTYGDHDEVDQLDECLVPYDFDWSPQHAIVDNDFRDLYSQLPYGCHFVSVFDCCHSGGMTREGGRKVRGLTPPDDIRHRGLRWESDAAMWRDRQFESLNADLDPRGGRAVQEAYLGVDGATRRLGRAATYRRLPARTYNRVRTELGHHGPYLPVIMEACQENQLSYEFRHGASSYGAYTYSLADILRRERTSGGNPTFRRLNTLVARRLAELKYDQRPNLVGAGHVVSQPVPWVRSGTRRPAPGRSKRRIRRGR
jgi:hypothetical protein